MLGACFVSLDIIKAENLHTHRNSHIFKMIFLDA